MAESPHVLILTTSLLTDRMLLWSDCVARLAERSSVEIWVGSLGGQGASGTWLDLPATVEPFPEVGPFRERFNLLRRANEAAWDSRLAPPSRLSMRRHRPRPSLPVATARALGRVLGALGLAAPLERRLESLLLAQERSPEAARRLDRRRRQGRLPDLVVTMSPFWFFEPAVVLEARRLGIPTVAMIPSWDNLSTKNRLVLRYDGYMVWSPSARDELRAVYPSAREVPVEAVGVPQYDAFFDPDLAIDRDRFLTPQGLDPALPTVVYALGSPNFLAGEPEGAVDLAGSVARGELGAVQMIVRPHPVHDSHAIRQRLSSFGPRVVVQAPSAGGSTPEEKRQDRDHIREWIGTFRHADVVVQLASTVALDAAFADRPVVNLAYDPDPSRADQALVREITTIWPHLQPMMRSGGVWSVDDPTELRRAVTTYLERPDLHAAERRAMLEAVCGFTDGRCGARLAAAIGNLADGVREVA